MRTRNSPRVTPRSSVACRRRCSIVSWLRPRARSGDPQLERVCREYLPLTFSRRHGDPSRPWNRFSITTRNADGTRSLNYEGNWRDIFQNWEALAVSFPGYTSGMICRFLNASTADGYNPYRITRNGIDWEVVDPHDPWSYIGYWGDHQIIYLLKLLELLERHEPEELRRLLAREIFAYANVPYRIKPYEKLLENPKDTVVFDAHLDKLIQQRVQAKGADGKLLWDKQGRVRLVNLTEKLLVPLLAKLSNFIPGAGIWLNTQRPEWNDANNALVGNGVLDGHALLPAPLPGFLPGPARVPLGTRASRCRPRLRRSLRRSKRRLNGTADCWRATSRMPSAGASLTILALPGASIARGFTRKGFSGRKTQVTTAAAAWISSRRRWSGRVIPSHPTGGRDGLYHAYNLVRFDSKAGLPIRRLYEMLEGQVAVLSSGQLSAEESLKLLAALKRSAMYRADQHSYLLYPNRQLPRFVEKEQHPGEGSPAVRAAAEAFGRRQPAAHRARHRRPGSLQRLGHQCPRHPPHFG